MTIPNENDISLCQSMSGLGMSCFGCCGHHFKKEQIIEGIRTNTSQFLELLEKHGLNKKEAFADQKNRKLFFEELKNKAVTLRECGVCRLLIPLNNLPNQDKNDKSIGCPLHHSRNEGTDYRENYCDLNHECKTFYYYQNWSRNEKDEFLKFLKKRISEGLCIIDLSISIENNNLLEEYLKR